MSAHSSLDDYNAIEELDSLHGSGTLSGVPTLSDSLDNVNVFDEDIPMNTSILSTNLTELEEGGSFLMASDRPSLNAISKNMSDTNFSESHFELGLYLSDMENDDKLDGSAVVEFRQLEAEVLGNAHLSRSRTALQGEPVAMRKEHGQRYPSTYMNSTFGDYAHHSSPRDVPRISELSFSNQYSPPNLMDVEISQYKHNPVDFFLDEDHAYSGEKDLETVNAHRPRPETQVDPIIVHDQMLQFLEQQQTTHPTAMKRHNSEPATSLKRSSNRLQRNGENGVDVPSRRVSFIQLDEVISPCAEMTSGEHTTASSVTGTTDPDDSRTQLKKQLEEEISQRERQERYIEQLQKHYDTLLAKHAMAELTIDHLRLGAHVNVTTTRRNTIGGAPEVAAYPPLSPILNMNSDTRGDTEDLTAAELEDLPFTAYPNANPHTSIFLNSDLHGHSMERHSSQIITSPSLRRNKSMKLFSSSPSLKDPSKANSPLDNIVTQTQALHAEANLIAELVSSTSANVMESTHAKVQELREAYDALQNECKNSQQSPLGTVDAVRTAEAGLFQLGMCLDDVEQRVGKMSISSTRNPPINYSSSSLPRPFNSHNVVLESKSRLSSNNRFQSTSSPTSVPEKPPPPTPYQNTLSSWQQETALKSPNSLPEHTSMKMPYNSSIDDLSMAVRKNLQELGSVQRHESEYRQMNESSCDPALFNVHMVAHHLAPNLSKPSPEQQIAASPHITTSSQLFSPDQLSDSGFVTLRTLPNSPSNSRLMVAPPASTKQAPNNATSSPPENNSSGGYITGSSDSTRRYSIPRPSTLSMREPLLTEPVPVSNMMTTSPTGLLRDDFQARRERIVEIQKEIRALRELISVKPEFPLVLNATSRTSSASTLRPGNAKSTQLPDHRNPREVNHLANSKHAFGRSLGFSKHTNITESPDPVYSRRSTEQLFQSSTMPTRSQISILSDSRDTRNYSTPSVHDVLPRRGSLHPLESVRQNLPSGVSNYTPLEGSAHSQPSPSRRRHSRRRRNEQYSLTSQTLPKDLKWKVVDKENSSDESMTYDEWLNRFHSKHRLSSPDIRASKSFRTPKTPLRSLKTIDDAEDTSQSPSDNYPVSRRPRPLHYDYRTCSQTQPRARPLSGPKMFSSTRSYSTPSLIPNLMARRRVTEDVREEIAEEANDLGIYKYPHHGYKVREYIPVPLYGSPDYEMSDDCVHYRVREYSNPAVVYSRPSRPIFETNPVPLSLVTPPTMRPPSAAPSECSRADVAQRQSHRRSTETDRDRLRDTLCDALLTMTRVAEQISNDLRSPQFTSHRQPY